MIKEFGIACNETSCMHVGTNMFQNTEIFKFVDVTSFSKRLDSDQDSIKIKLTQKYTIYYINVNIKNASCITSAIKAMCQTQGFPIFQEI